MLHLHSELTKDVVRDVGRQLRAKENPHTFGPDQFDHGFDLIEERLFRVGENEVRLVDKKNELGFLHVAYFRQGGVELGQQLEHERGKKFRPILHIAEPKNGDGAETIDNPQKILNFKRRLPEKLFRALLLEFDQLTQDKRTRGCWNQSIFRGHIRLGFTGDVFEDFFEVLQIEQRQMFVVAEFVDHSDQTRLRFVEPEHAGKKKRTEFKDS